MKSSQWRAAAYIMLVEESRESLTGKERREREEEQGKNMLAW